MAQGDMYDSDQSTVVGVEPGAYIADQATKVLQDYSHPRIRSYCSISTKSLHNTRRPRATDFPSVEREAEKIVCARGENSGATIRQEGQASEC